MGFWFVSFFILAILLSNYSFSQAVFYEVWVKTGTVSGAGTDSKIWIILKNEFNEESPECFLLNSNNYNPFESGQTDKFQVQVNTDLGPIKGIRLHSDNSGHEQTWFVDSVKVYYPAPSGIDRRYPIEGNKNVTNFKFGGWISQNVSLTVDLNTIDKIGDIVNPVKFYIIRSIYNSAQVEVIENFGTSDVTGSKKFSYETQDQVQYNQTEGILSQNDFDTKFKANLWFVETTVSLKRSVETSCTKFNATLNTVRKTETDSINYSIKPYEIAAILTERYDVQSEGSVGYKEVNNTKQHDYTTSFPSTPSIDWSLVYFTATKKSDGYYLEPTNPGQKINQAIIDKLKEKGYKFDNKVIAKLPLTSIKIKGLAYPIPIKKTPIFKKSPIAFSN